MTLLAKFSNDQTGRALDEILMGCDAFADSGLVQAMELKTSEWNAAIQNVAVAEDTLDH